MMYSDHKGPINIDVAGCIKAIVFGEKVSTFLTNALEDSLNKMGIQSLKVYYDTVSNKLVCEST